MTDSNKDRYEQGDPVTAMFHSMSIPRQAVLVASLIMIVLIVYWPSPFWLWKYWLYDVGSSSGAPVVVLISLWLLLRSRGNLAEAPLEPVPWVFPALLACSAGWTLFWLAGIETLQLMVLPAIMYLAILAALGRRIARVVAFPLGFLYLAMPAWGYLAPLLQLLTIRAVSILAPLVGVPARTSGDVVMLPGTGGFEIGVLCSGVQFFSAGLAVGAFIGELEHASLRRRASLIALMGAIAILSNWVRVLLIIAIGYATHLRNPLATSDHLYFGWIIFAVAMLLFLWFAPRKPAPTGGDPKSTTHGPQIGIQRSTIAAFAATSTLLVFPAWAYGMNFAHVKDVRMVDIRFPPGNMSWRGPFSGRTDTVWQPAFVGSHSQQQYVYDGPASRSVEVVAIGYPQQRQGQELVNGANSLVGKYGLTAISYGLAAVDGQPFREIVAEDGSGHRSLIWWVYDIGGRRFANPLYSEFWYGIRALAWPPYSVLFAFRTSCRSSCSEARQALRSFLESEGKGLFTTASQSRSNTVRGHA